MENSVKESEKKMEKTLPLVSVIIPIYNVERYLLECLDSVINQTYRNLEIILVDDGSSDNCGEICDEYALKDPRIRVIHKKNGGVSSARNVGMSVSTGDWIYFCDPDDTIEKELVGIILDTVLKDGTDMAFFDYNVCNGERVINCQSLRCNENIFRDLQSIETLLVYFSNMGSVCYFIIRAKVIRNKIRFDEMINFCEDEVFKFQIYSQIKSFSYLPKTLYHYRVNPNSTSAAEKLIRRKDYPDMMYRVYYKMMESINSGNYPPNACIVANTRLLDRLPDIVKIAFQDKISFKCDYEMIRNYMDTNEYREAHCNYDKQYCKFSYKPYALLKKPNRVFITLIYFMIKIVSIFKKLF